MTERDESHDDGALRRFLRRPGGIAICVALAIGGAILLLEHRVHVLASLPLILPLAICLAMHLFMHRGHGGGGK